MENNPVNVRFTQKRTSKGGKCHVLETPSERDDMCIYTLRWLANTNHTKTRKNATFPNKKKRKFDNYRKKCNFQTKTKIFL